MSTSFKKSFTKVRSTLNRTASKLTLSTSNNNNNNNTDENNDTVLGISTSPPDSINQYNTDFNEVATTAKDSSENFGLKYEDIERRNSQLNRKRNFSLVTSVSSSHQKKSSESSNSISRSQSVASFHDTTDNTLVFHPDDPLNESIERDSMMLFDTTNVTVQNGDDGLLPPIPKEGQPPCNNEELSPTIPSSFSPISQDINEEPFSSVGIPSTSRQNSSSSSISMSGAPSRVRLLSSLRPSSVASQSSMSPLPLGNISTINESSTGNNYSTSEIRNSISVDPLQSNEDDIADAMAISILEKVPHHQELSVEDWCI